MQNKNRIAPELTTPQVLTAPLPEKTQLKNGIQFYNLSLGDHAVIRVSFVFRAGTRYQQYPFSASAALSMLSEGTESRSAAEIAETIDFYGFSLDTTLDRDYAIVTICTLSKFLPEALSLVSDLICNPTYDADELRSYAAKRKQQLGLEREKPAFQARELFGEALWGKNHPYGKAFHEREYDQLTPRMLADFQRKYYTASGCFVVASGRVTSQDAERICATASRIPVGERIESNEVFPIPISTFLRNEVHPGALQSALRIGKLLFDRNHPDFNGMQVLSTLLGGYFGSRLVRNLREDKGYTYGIFSAMINLELGGYLAIATEVSADVTELAIREIYREMDQLREILVPEEELTAVRNIMIGELMRILDGPFGIADVTIENIQNGATNHYVSDFFEEICTITPERLRELARRYFIRSDFSTVVVGAEFPG